MVDNIIETTFVSIKAQLATATTLGCVCEMGKLNRAADIKMGDENIMKRATYYFSKHF